MNDYLYPKGYVESVSGYMVDSGTLTVLIVNSVNGVIIRKLFRTGTGEVTLNVHEYIGVPFYIAIGGTGIAFFSSNYGMTSLNFITITNDSNLYNGNNVSIEFPERSSNTNIYSLAQKVTYSSVKKQIYPTMPTNSRNVLFVAGDSITAGHNSYEVGNHWWEAVSRKYGYIPKPAARTGAGYSYWNGINGCKIARNADFSNIAVAVFAFGTNDYGNNIPIGTIDDVYSVTEDSSQTFYACVKYVIETVLTANPLCTLILSLPINRSREGTYATQYAYGTVNTQGKTLLDYCDAIIACCEKYGINYIDNRKGSFNLLSLPNLLYDGLHPTINGYKILGQNMIGKLGALIAPYPEYDGIDGYGEF
jgi:lysophospholipase L1-like esterase